jgi:hypothetical protein
MMTDEYSGFQAARRNIDEYAERVRRFVRVLMSAMTAALLPSSRDFSMLDGTWHAENSSLRKFF